MTVLDNLHAGVGLQAHDKLDHEKRPDAEENARPMDRLPQALRELPQWCVAGPDKSPLMTNGQRANVKDPASWTDFDSACRAAEADGRHVGFVLTASDPFTCIDLDVKDHTPAKHIERFDKIVTTFDSYAERSRSGLGLHVWVEGNIGRGRRSRDGVEVYSQERFIICTGNVVRDRPIVGRPELLDTLVMEMGSTPAAKLDLSGDDDPDHALAGRASLDGGELGRLFRGDWEGRYPSQSEADLALVKLLMPHSESPGECWRTFRLSNLGQRDKAGRADYAQSTLGLAAQHLANDAAQVQHGRELASSLFWQAPPHNQRHFHLLLDGDLDRLPSLRWLVKGIIPDAGIGAIYGDSGTFKSFLTLDALAHIANGLDWFGRRVRPAPAVYVPFEGQGGIPNRVRAWRLTQAAQRNPDVLFSIIPPDDVRTNVAVIVEPMNLRDQADRDKLVATLTENGWAGGVLCVDTLAHASNGIDENSSAMGEMLSIFRDLQHRLGGVILVIHHSGKDQARGMRGWSGLHAAMDFVVECQHDKNAGHRDAQFVLTKVKDGESGGVFGFMMQAIQLGFDEDGDAITSLIVSPSQTEVEPAGKDKTAKKGKGIRDIDAETAAADNKFMWQWVADQVRTGNYPSKNSLKGQLPDMKETYEITQDRVLAAVERLFAEGRLMQEKVIKSDSGNVWIRPVDVPQGADGPPGSLA